MQHLTFRCKHCQRTYTYCTYGNGPEYGTEAGCSKEYCAECQNAINEALGKIDVKCKPAYKEIRPTLGVPELLEKIKNDEERRLAEEREKNGFTFPSVYPFAPDEGYDNVEEYTHGHKTFRVEWNDGEEDNKHYFLCMEYDIKNQQYTGNVWEAKDGKDSYTKIHGYTRTNKLFQEAMKEAFSADARPMKLPTGNLFYMNPATDCEWELVAPKVAPKPKEHKLTTFTWVIQGKSLKRREDNDEYVFPVDFNFDDVCEYLDYNVTFEKYEDEDVRMVIKVEVK